MKNKNLNKCVCGKVPEIIKSKHNLLEKVVFSIICKNPRCETHPKTEDCFTLRMAKKQWNNNIITDSLF